MPTRPRSSVSGTKRIYERIEKAGVAGVVAKNDFQKAEDAFGSAQVVRQQARTREAAQPRARTWRSSFARARGAHAAAPAPDYAKRRVDEPGGCAPRSTASSAALAVADKTVVPANAALMTIVDLGASRWSSRFRKPTRPTSGSVFMAEISTPEGKVAGKLSALSRRSFATRVLARPLHRTGSPRTSGKASAYPRGCSSRRSPTCRCCRAGPSSRRAAAASRNCQSTAASPSAARCASAPPAFPLSRSRTAPARRSSSRARIAFESARARLHPSVTNERMLHVAHAELEQRPPHADDRDATFARLRDPRPRRRVVTVTGRRRDRARRRSPTSPACSRRSTAASTRLTAST